MLKKFFSLFILLALLAPSVSFAQSQTQCSNINSTTYPSCCPSAISAVGVACVNFKIATCSTNPNDPICQNGAPTTGGGGAPNTNPTNSGTNPGTIAPTPQASSQALQSCNLISFDSLLDILIWLKCVIGAAIIPLIFTITFLVFLWGMFGYIRDANDVKKREESKKFIYYGIIGLTVMVGVWGIVRIVTSTFGLGNTVPQLQTDCLTTDKNNPCKN